MKENMLTQTFSTGYKIDSYKQVYILMIKEELPKKQLNSIENIPDPESMNILTIQIFSKVMCQQMMSIKLNNIILVLSQNSTYLIT